MGWLEDTMNTREAMAGISRGVTITKVGCPFFDRCPVAIEGTCEKIDPPARLDTHGHDHVIECHREIDELGAPGAKRSAAASAKSAKAKKKSNGSAGAAKPAATRKASAAKKSVAAKIRAGKTGCLQNARHLRRNQPQRARNRRQRP